MMQNNIKAEIKGVLEEKGYRNCVHNIELVYQVYMANGAKVSIDGTIREVANCLKRAFRK